MVLFCGEPLPYYLAKAWSLAAPNATVENIYGPTEATIAFTSYQWVPLVNGSTHEIVSIGKPFQGLKIKIVNEHFQECRLMEVGELLLGGPQVAEGYLNAPQKTAEKFFRDHNNESWYKTGDFVFINKDENLYFKGRIDDQLQIRGQRIERVELEKKIRDVLSLSSIAVIPSPVTTDGLVLGIGLIYMLENDMTDEMIRKICNEKLTFPFLPSLYVRIDSFPLNSSGKIDYNALKKKYQKKEYLGSEERSVKSD